MKQEHNLKLQEVQPKYYHISTGHTLLFSKFHKRQNQLKA